MEHCIREMEGGTMYNDRKSVKISKASQLLYENFSCRACALNEFDLVYLRCL